MFVYTDFQTPSITDDAVGMGWGLASQKMQKLLIQGPHFETTDLVSRVCVWALNGFSRVWLCDPMDCSPPGSSVHGILQARILERVAMPSSRGSSRPRDWTMSLSSPALAGGFFITRVGIIRYATFWDWHFSLSIITVRSIQVIACITGSFFIAEWYWMA